jgi:phage repressor protein C with HTH and peptisase S24 domain
MFLKEKSRSYRPQGIAKKRQQDILRKMLTKKDIALAMGANLSRVRKAHRLSQAQLAELINSTASYISQMEKGHCSISVDMMAKLCNSLKVEASEFTIQADNRRQIPPPAGEIAVISMGQGGPEGYYEDAYPVGHGFRYIKRPYDVTDENAYAVEVRGLSMSPRYEEGEIVVASPQKEVSSGDYAVIKLVTGEVMIKRIKFRDGLIILSSVNHAVEPWIYKPEEITFYHKIVWKKEK